MENLTGCSEVSHSVKGSYVLLIEFHAKQPITVGSLGLVGFQSSYYAYVGSAMRGLGPRINRHLSRHKKLHWHIDYLLQEAAVTGIITCESGEKVECGIAQALSRQFDVISGFGSSDCRCPGHLFVSDEEMVTGVLAACKSLGLAPLLKENKALQVTG